jgi:bifunctional ADP-heptose synthase (sugar kinase/adenylyltransferase)
MLKKYRVKLNPIYALDKTTTEKSIYTSKGHNLLKVNNVNNEPINQLNLESIISKIKKTECDIFVIADYRHGIFNKESCKKIVKSIRKKSFKVADSQVASRWGNILDFKYFDLITPTEQEARYSLFEQDLTIRALADKLLKLSKSKNIILKIGERGLIALGKNNPDYISLDPFVDKLVDTNGAGDALLAYSAATLFKEKSILAASIMGLIAASCKCEKKGNLPITQDEIKQKIENIKKNISYEN